MTVIVSNWWNSSFVLTFIQSNLDCMVLVFDTRHAHGQPDRMMAVQLENKNETNGYCSQ